MRANFSELMKLRQGESRQLGKPDWTLFWDTEKREIRRVFGHFRYQIKKLRRVSIGGLHLNKLPLGSFRELNQKEIDLLLPR